VAAAGGHALLAVREIVPGFTVPFESVAEALRLDLARQRAEPDADRLAEAVEDLRAGGATLEEVAAELGLTLFRDEGVARDGTGAAGPLSGLAASTAFLDDAFEAVEGDERRIVPAPDGGYFVLRVDGVRAPSVPVLDAIRDRVAAGWRAEATRAALRAEAEALKAEFDGGADLAALAAARGLEITSIGPLRRGDPDPRLGPEAREALFAAEPGTAALSAAGGGTALLVLREVLPVEPQGDAVRALEQALAQSVAQDLFDYLGQALEDRAGVSVNTTVLDSVVSQIGG
jgi:peptidyl-prolyl cis-trans isomerase D